VRHAPAVLLLSIVSTLACKKESGGTTSAPSCEDRAHGFDEAVSSSTAGVCSTDADCRCYPGGVSKDHSCGGITDRDTAEKLAKIAADYHQAGCHGGTDCAATLCLATCRAGKCTGGTPPATEAGISCDARGAEIDKVLASGSLKCATDKDCACFRGGVSKTQPCGGITDAKTNARFEALAKDWSAAGCKMEGIACPAMVCATTCNAGTCGSPTADKIVQ
jgi:hypothetical protein